MLDKINSFVLKQLNISKIPGCSIIVIDNGKIVLKRGYGYADIKNLIPVSEDTLFEIGSTSKAFTALGIMWLIKRELINIDDLVSKYLPWFFVKYKKKQVSITIKNLIHHTSGLPFNTIMSIPESNENDALENTIRTIVGRELDFLPGKKFLYTTINYDILGLIIEKVSNKQFEHFIKENILLPLGLKNTYLGYSEINKEIMSRGYKVEFLQKSNYLAPIYRGNTPAGYYITNINDISTWIQLQLNIIKNLEFEELITESHSLNTSVKMKDNLYYGLGWVRDLKKGYTYHIGKNPNFASFILLNPQQKMGVAILGNLNSSSVYSICIGIADILKGKKPVYMRINLLLLIDIVSTALIIILPFKMIWGLKEILLYVIHKGTLKFLKNIIVFSSLSYIIYRILQNSKIVKFYNMNFFKVWGPRTLVYAIKILLIYLYLYLINLLC